MNSNRAFLTGAALLAAVLLASFTVACGSDGTVSGDELGKQVKASFEDQSGVTLETIECGEVKAEAGQAFACNAANSIGIDLKIVGKVTSYDSDAGTIKFDWGIASAQAPGDNYESAARQSLRKQTGVALTAVTCPDRIELKAGTTVTCTAVDAKGNKRQLMLTLTDPSGGFKVRLKGSNQTN